MRRKGGTAVPPCCSTPSRSNRSFRSDCSWRSRSATASSRSRCGRATTEVRGSGRQRLLRAVVVVAVVVAVVSCTTLRLD